MKRGSVWGIEKIELLKQIGRERKDSVDDI